MKTQRKFLPIIVALSVLLSAFFVMPASAASSYDITGDYAGNIKSPTGQSTTSNNGIVDRVNSATLEKTTFKSQSSLKITPNPDGAPSHNQIKLDHYTLNALNLSLTDLKYVSIYCYYDGQTELSRAVLKMMPQNGKNVIKVCDSFSDKEIKKGEWQWLNFDVGSSLYSNITAGSILSQFHLLPYGEITLDSLSESDVMYISKIRYVSHDKVASSGIVGKYEISFSAGRADVLGDAPQSVLASVGETVILPENTFTRKNYSFDGWICSANGQKYNAGDSYSVTERKRIGNGSSLSSGNLTGEAIFYPDWVADISAPYSLPDVLSASYSTYQNGLLGNKNCVTVTKNYDYNGRKLLKLDINTASSDVINLDGWEWNKLPFDLDKYKYVTVIYRYETENPLKFTPVMRLLTGGDALSQSVLIPAESEVVSNEWSVMAFDLSTVEQYFNPDVDSHILKQFHFQLTGGAVRANQFTNGDVIYIDAITLYAEKPLKTPTYTESLLNGYGDGTFRPGNYLKRAEAAQIIYNILKFKNAEIPKNAKCIFNDVSESDGCYEAICAVGALGYVEGGSFRPNDDITVGEFALLLTDIGLGGNDEPRFATSDNSKITRGNAAIVLCDFLGVETPEQFKQTYLRLFDDVTFDSAEYNAVTALAASRVSSFDRNGTETVFQVMGSNNDLSLLEYPTMVGAKYIKTLNATENERIGQIRNAESVFTVGSGGKIYYVSSSSGSSDGGSSADNPKKISKLSEVSSLGATKGDVVLFKRGDIFRGQLTTAFGVTYSAYGEGAKPEFRRSEKNHSGGDNWEIYFSDTASGKKIWKTSSVISADVGAVVINDGEIVGVKEIPNFINGSYFVRGSENNVPFVIETELDNNHEFFHDLGGNLNGGGKYLYFRCDEGNPGELFESIEMNERGNCVGAASNVTIDNICIKYFGSHGIGAGTVSNLKITNCEIGWGGGSIQYFNSNGVVVRFGNGVEIYGGCVNYTIDNCYVYEIYDAGITHQISSGSAGNYYMKNVLYTNNVLTDSTYNIEYFMSSDSANGASERFMENVLFENNILRRAGYGWGVQRPDPAPSNIKGWTHNNNAVNYVIKNNVFDRCVNARGSSLNVQVGSSYSGSAPYFENNVFVQVPKRGFAYIHNKTYSYNVSSALVMSELYGNDNTFLFAPEDSY